MPIIKSALMMLCPLAATGVAIKTVEPVRHFVNRATAEKRLPRPAKPRPAAPAAESYVILDRPAAVPCAVDLSTHSMSGPPGVTLEIPKEWVPGYIQPGRRVPPPVSIIIPQQPIQPLPEPASWALMLAGFGTIGAAMRGHMRMLA